MLALMSTIVSLGQTATESFSYALDQYIEKCTGVPLIRPINGGTVFKITYEPEELWDNAMRGAFEYACKIWEEQLPNSLPINITAKIGNIRGASNMNLLSKVQSTTYDTFGANESVLSSRIKYVLLAEYNSGPNAMFVDNITDADFFDKPDIVITYNKKFLDEFSYSLDINPVDKYDFVTVVLRDIARGLGFSFNMTANNQMKTLEDTNRPLTYYENLVKQAIGGSNLYEAYANSTKGLLTLSCNNHNDTISLYAPPVWQNGVSLNYLIPEESKKISELLTYNFGKGSVIRNISDNYNNIFYDFQGWRTYNTLTGFNYISESSDGSSANIMDYNGNLSVSGNYGVLKSTAQKTGANMVRGLNDNLTSGEDFNLKSYLFPYNYMYPDIYGSGAWLVSLLRKDGTWDLVYRQDPYGALVTKMSEWNISPNYEQYQRTCDGYIRCRITHYYKIFDQLYRKEYYNIANYYYVLDYLPQQVKMRYSAPEKASSALFAETASMSDDYTQDIKITIKNLEGVNNVIVEQFDEGNDLPLKFEVNDFKKGYFIANVEKDLSTKFVVYSYNKNGYAKSETLIVPPSVVYNSDVKINGNKISIDNGLLTKHGPINYAIYSTSPSSVIQVKEGVLKDKNTMIGISELAKGSYILVLKSGITSKSVKFVK